LASESSENDARWWNHRSVHQPTRSVDAITAKRSKPARRRGRGIREFPYSFGHEYSRLPRDTSHDSSHLGCSNRYGTNVRSCRNIHITLTSHNHAATSGHAASRRLANAFNPHVARLSTLPTTAPQLFKGAVQRSQRTRSRRYPGGTQAPSNKRTAPQKRALNKHAKSCTNGGLWRPTGGAARRRRRRLRRRSSRRRRFGCRWRRLPTGCGGPRERKRVRRRRSPPHSGALSIERLRGAMREGCGSNATSGLGMPRTERSAPLSPSWITGGWIGSSIDASTRPRSCAATIERDVEKAARVFALVLQLPQTTRVWPKRGRKRPCFISCQMDEGHRLQGVLRTPAIWHHDGQALASGQAHFDSRVRVAARAGLCRDP
jgi:hypothetical protein